MSDEQRPFSLARSWPIAFGVGLVAVWILWPREVAEPGRVPGDDAKTPALVTETTNPARPDRAPDAVAASVPVEPVARPQGPVAHGEAPAPPVPAYQEPPYELPIVGPAPDDPHDQAMHPHPISEGHVRIQKINGLIQNLNDAMSNRDVKAMRALVTEFKALDPADEDNFQLGYAVVADCIESPGRASVEAARRFYDTYRASPLRRFVRRLCFEPGS